MHRLLRRWHDRPGHHHHRHRNLPKAFQGRASRIYDLVARRALRPVYRRLARDVAAAAPHAGTVLDLGTGPGVLLAEIARLRPDLRLTGIDLSPDMVTAAERNLREFGERADARCGDVTDLPCPDGSVDLVVSSFSMHHWDDPRAAGPELARVLRPGGHAYLYDFPFAPFRELTEATAGTSLSAPPGHTATRVRIPLFPKVVRYVVARAWAQPGRSVAPSPCRSLVVAST